MKKTGFTLSELLITLTVIGVVSALVLPAVSGILPDKNKAKVIKYNAMINNAINEIFSDESVYHPYTIAVGEANNYATFLTNNGEDECSGLGCISGEFEAEIERRFINKVKDGSTWTVSPAESDGTFILSVVTDEKTSKAFSSNGDNKNINTFYFNIDEYGNVKPGDALTEAFLKNYKKLNDRKADIGDADTILDEISKKTRKDYYTKKTTSN